MATWPDRGDTEDIVGDREIGEDCLGQIADLHLMLPIGTPRLAPEDPVTDGAWHTLPAEVRIVATRPPPEHRLSPPTHHIRCWRRECCRRYRGEVHPCILGEILGIDSIWSIEDGVLSLIVLLRLGEADRCEAALVEWGMIASSPETVLTGDQTDMMRGHVPAREAPDMPCELTRG